MLSYRKQQTRTNSEIAQATLLSLASRNTAFFGATDERAAEISRALELRSGGTEGVV